MRALRCGAAVLALTALTAEARAGSPYEIGVTGAENLGRAGAWTARASTPLAVAENPAALAWQPAGVEVGAALAVRDACFSRVKDLRDTTDDGVAPGGRYPRVCDDGLPLPVGFAALAVPLGRVSFGLSLSGPSGVPHTRYPSFVDGRPAPQRYLLLESRALFARPTAALAARLSDAVALGASLTWGVAWLESSAATSGLATPGQRPAENDVKSTVEAFDGFVPGAGLGALVRAGSLLDLAATGTVSAPIDARGDARTEANAFAPRARDGDTSRVVRGDTSLRDCGVPGVTACGGGGNARVTLPMPMELRVAARLHVPRGEARSGTRDPLRDERFDLELDLGWTRASTIDASRIRFPAGAGGAGILPVAGTAGAIPPIADVPRAYRDVLSVRAGGDVSVVPERLALRAGVSYETAAAPEGAVEIDLPSSAKLGFGFGATLRAVRRDERSSGPRSVDVLVALAQVRALPREGSGSHGAFTGAPCASGAPAGGTCVDGTPAHRTPWFVDAGAFTSVTRIVQVALVASF